MSILYVTFQDAVDAEKAAGALIDHGVARQDLTITSKSAYIAPPHNSDYEAAVQAGENEGWPARTADEIASEQESVDRHDDQANERYQEADHAERSAKTGISITTLNDTVIGALRGGFVGACIAIVVGILWIVVPAHAGLAMYWRSIIFASVIGVAAGTVVGGVIGLLRDLGAAVDNPGPRRVTKSARPVLLAVEVPSGNLDEDQARRLVSKYHASSIDRS
jgi:hypothetical protein